MALDIPDGHNAVLTSQANGAVQMADGTVYNVTPDTIAVAAHHTGELVHHIEKMMESAGSLDVTDADGVVHKWAHVCSESCPAAPPAA